MERVFRPALGETVVSKGKSCCTPGFCQAFIRDIFLLIHKSAAKRCVFRPSALFTTTSSGGRRKAGLTRVTFAAGGLVIVSYN